MSPKPFALVLLMLITAFGLAQVPPKPKTSNRNQLVLVDCRYDWPKEEVPWIIPDEERAAYYKLKNDEERDNFIEQFWLRRDPTPDTVENEFRDEYYMRILYANEHFSTKERPGWKTDRGKIYVKYGPPDTVEVRVDRGHPASRWHYRWVEEVGTDIDLEFIDVSGNGDYQYQIPEGERDFLVTAPKKLSSAPPVERQPPANEFHGLEIFVGPAHVPSVRLRDLEEIASHHVPYASVPFQLDLKFNPVTKRTVQVPVKLKFRSSQLKWNEENGKATARVQVFGRWMTMTGRIVQIIEDEVTFDRPIVPETPEANSDRSITIPVYIYDGTYRLDLVVKDVNADRMGTMTRDIKVPGSGWCK
jgi:GWxTD domain-containing protein